MSTQKTFSNEDRERIKGLARSIAVHQGRSPQTSYAKAIEFIEYETEFLKRITPIYPPRK